MMKLYFENYLINWLIESKRTRKNWVWITQEKKLCLISKYQLDIVTQVMLKLIRSKRKMVTRLKYIFCLLKSEIIYREAYFWSFQCRTNKTIESYCTTKDLWWVFVLSKIVDRIGWAGLWCDVMWLWMKEENKVVVLYAM